MMLKKFDSLNYEINRPLAIAKNKKVVELLKDKLGRNIMSLLHLDQKHILT